MASSYVPPLRRGQTLVDYRHERVWRNMLQRCNNPRNPGYHNYGGRGVTVCARWDPSKGGSYANFIADMGYRPSDRHQLDKEAVDPSNLVYCPEMCRWVTTKENNHPSRKRTPSLCDQKSKVCKSRSKAKEQEPITYWFISKARRRQLVNLSPSTP